MKKCQLVRRSMAPILTINASCCAALPETRSRQDTDEFRLMEFAMNEVLDTAKSFATVFAGLFVAVAIAVGGLALVLNLVKLALP
jgi:hypothetical protein